MALPLSGAEGISIFGLILFFLIFWSGYRQKKVEGLWWYFLAIMLLFFGVTHYHPQWYVWLTPFLIIELVKNNFRHLWLSVVLIASWLAVTLFFESSLNFALFSPLNPNLLEMMPISDIVMRFYNVFTLKTHIRSAAAAASIVLAYLAYSRKDELA